MEIVFSWNGWLNTVTSGSGDQDCDEAPSAALYSSSLRPLARRALCWSQKNLRPWGRRGFP